MIDTENLTKRFGDLTAVDSVTFRVDECEVFGFLGPRENMDFAQVLISVWNPRQLFRWFFEFQVPAIFLLLGNECRSLFLFLITRRSMSLNTVPLTNVGGALRVYFTARNTEYLPAGYSGFNPGISLIVDYSP